MTVFNGLWTLIFFSLSFSAMGLSEEKQKILSTHNQLRKQHHSPPLQWDSDLANYAEKYAARCELKHSHGGYGENIAAGFAFPKLAILAWYAESKDYSYQHAHFSKLTGHFTQVVWRSSEKIGCGSALCNGKNGTPGTFFVCEYSPAGNVTNEGYFEYNVRPPRRPSAQDNFAYGATSMWQNYVSKAAL